MNKKSNNKEFLKTVLLFLLAIFSTIAFSDIVSISSLREGKFLFLEDGIMTSFILAFFFFLWYLKFYKEQKKNRWFFALALLFSVFMTFGKSFMKLDTWNLVFGNFACLIYSLISFLGYFFFLYSLIFCGYEFIRKHSIFHDMRAFKKVKDFFDRHPFWGTVIILLICWLPYIIAYYPAILSPDPSNQIKQFYGLPTHYIEGVNILDPNVLITNHHPFLHTLLLGGLTKLGDTMGSVNLGLFFYSFIQIVILVSTLAYTIVYMKKLKTPYWLRCVFLLIYAFVPVFPFYAMSPVKDVIFGSLIILYTILLFDMIHFKKLPKGIWQYVKVILLVLAMMLIRNNGIHVFILSFPFLFFLFWKEWKCLSICFVVPIVIFIGYSKLLLPALKITPGSVRELLSIPFQQTARCALENPDDVPLDEKEAIDKVLGYDDLAERYNSGLADPVKNEFNKDASKEDLKRYFGVWIKQFFRCPSSYIHATISNTYGYFYPNKTSWYLYSGYNPSLEEAGIDYHYNGLDDFRKILKKNGDNFRYIPILGLIVNIGFQVWLVFFMAISLIVSKKYRYLIYLLPALVLILICVASPANAYFRYALPYVFAMPILLSMFIFVSHVKEK